jgi:hypothetical protein
VPCRTAERRMLSKAKQQGSEDGAQQQGSISMVLQ